MVRRIMDEDENETPIDDLFAAVSRSAELARLHSEKVTLAWVSLLQSDQETLENVCTVFHYLTGLTNHPAISHFSGMAAGVHFQRFELSDQEKQREIILQQILRDGDDGAPS